MGEFALIVGLGNPGPAYAHNRHNIGFRTLDRLAEIYQQTFSRTEHHASTAHGTAEGERVILAKPQTWMNESGKAVSPLASFYKVSPDRILVIYDDLDIPLGTVRFRMSGSSGGHRGVQSIIQQLGTQDFPRLRLGIGRPPGKMDPAAYVLQNFSTEEELLLEETLRLAKTLIKAWLNRAPDFLKPGMTWRVDEPANASVGK